MPDLLDRCSFPQCNKIRESSAPPFPYCGKCKARRYCSKECQRRDWKVHKRHCQNLAQFLEKTYPTAPPGSYVQYLVRDLVTARDVEDAERARDSDTVFYKLTRNPLETVGEYSWAGPSYPAAVVEDAIKNSLKMIPNVIESGQFYEKVLAPYGGISGIYELRVALLDGNIMTNRIVAEHNPGVAALWRNNPGRSKPTWLVVAVTPKLGNMSNDGTITDSLPGVNNSGDNWPKIFGSYLSVEEANQKLGSVVQQWKIEYPPPEYGHTSYEQDGQCKSCFVSKKTGDVQNHMMFGQKRAISVDGDVIKHISVTYSDGSLLNLDTETDFYI